MNALCEMCELGSNVSAVGAYCTFINPSQWEKEKKSWNFCSFDSFADVCTCWQMSVGNEKKIVMYDGRAKEPPQGAVERAQVRCRHVQYSTHILPSSSFADRSNFNWQSNVSPASPPWTCHTAERRYCVSEIEHISSSAICEIVIIKKCLHSLSNIIDDKFFTFFLDIYLDMKLKLPARILSINSHL